MTQAHFHERENRPAMVEAMAARTLQFLALIESTVDVVASNTDHVRACAKGVVESMDTLKGHFGEQPIEAEDRLVELLVKTSDAARRIHADAKRRHAAACSDSMLRPDDGVVDVYVDFIEAVEDLFNCSEEFREWVETHNALLEPSTGVVYSTAEDLIAALNAD